MSSEEDPLSGFKKSECLETLNEILNVIGSKSLVGNEKIQILSNLFESLSIIDGSMTSKYWSGSDDYSTLSIWSMLSYFYHCTTNEFSEKYKMVVRKIEINILVAIEKDLLIFGKIHECELRREKLNFLELDIFRIKVQRSLKITEEDFIVSTKEQDELDKIKATKYYSHCYKLDNSKKVWEKYSEKLGKIHPDLQTQVSNYECVVAVNNLIDRYKSEVIQIDLEIKSCIKTANLNQVKREIQGLHEYESYRIILESLHQLLDETHFDHEALDSLAFSQWLVSLYEGLKFLVADECLGITTDLEFLEIKKVIRPIRTFLEHPEDCVFQTDSTSEKKVQHQILEANMFKDLKLLAKELKQSLGIRLLKFDDLFSSEIDDVLYKIALRPIKKQQITPVDIKNIVGAKYPSMVEYSKRIYEKIDYKKEYYKKLYNQDLLYIPIIHEITNEDLLEMLKESCKVLKETICPTTRSDLDHKLKKSLSFFLKIQRMLSCSTRLLKLYITKYSRNEVDEHLFNTIETLYFQSRDARNFQTHDIWRTDYNRVINTTFIFAFDLPLSLNGSKRKFSNSIEEKIIQMVCDNKINEEYLEKVVNEEMIDVNAVDYQYRGLLHFLVENNQLNMAKFIISHGASIHQADLELKRPIHYAAEKGLSEIVEYLVELGAVVDSPSKNGTPEELAEHSGYHELAQLLDVYKVDKRSSNICCLLNATKNLQLQLVKDLVKKGFHPMVSYLGSLPLVSLFRKKCENPGVKLQIAHVLLEVGLDINQKERYSGDTVLHAAAEYSDNLQEIDFLVSHRPSVNIHNNEEESPLHIAIRAGNKNWVKALINVGADVNLKGRYGSPIIYACDRNNPSIEIIKDLLDCGADINTENEYGQPIHYAAKRGPAEIIDLLLSFGADPMAIGKGGQFKNKTPHQIIKSRQIKVDLQEERGELAPLSKDFKKIKLDE